MSSDYSKTPENRELIGSMSRSTSGHNMSSASPSYEIPSPVDASISQIAESCDDDITDLDIASIFEIPGPPSSIHLAPVLQKPIALPKTSARYDSPIVRAWAPELSHFDITETTWLAFLEGLSYAMIGSPPLQVLDLVGQAIGLVPHHWFLIAGLSTQVIARTGQQALSRGLTDRYLSRANREFFGPRKLKARLMTGEALRVLVGMQDKGKSKWAAFGRGAGHVYNVVPLPIIRPIVDRVITLANTVTASDQNQTLSHTNYQQEFAHRRLDRFQDHVAQLSFDVPDPIKPKGLIDQTSALAVKFNKRKLTKAESQKKFNQDLLAVAQGRMSSQEYMNRYTASRSGSGSGPTSVLDTRKGRKEAKKIQKREEDFNKGKSPSKGLQRRVARSQKDELYAEDKALWLIVHSAEEDKLIAGVEALDSDEPLNVTEEEMQYELDLEAKEYAESCSPE